MGETERRRKYKRLNRGGGELVKRQTLLQQEIVAELLRCTRNDFSRSFSPGVGGVAQATENGLQSFNGGNVNVPESYRLSIEVA